MPVQSPPNTEQSDLLATFDRQLRRFRDDGLYWLDDVPSSDLTAKLAVYRAIYVIVEEGPAYTTEGVPRSKYVAIWISWPPGPV